MATQSFTDTNVNNLIKNIRIEDLQTLVADMKKDFDKSLAARFSLSSSQSETTSVTPAFFKTVITSAFESLLTIRKNGATGNFTMAGLNTDGSGGGLQQADLKISLSHQPDCTWNLEITFTKD